MDGCTFCKIVKGEIPSYKLYEDELFYGLLDIFPRTRGHSLLLPKIHYRWVYDVPEFGKYWEGVKVISDAMRSAMNPTFITYVTHGLEVPHAHIHIMPRFHETEYVPEVKKQSVKELEKVHKLITDAIKPNR